MWKHGDKKQKELEKREGDLASHKPVKKRPDKTASTKQVNETARAEHQDAFNELISATPQPTDISQTPPPTEGSEHTLTADSPVIMISPYRINKEDCFPRISFSKNLLIHMDHDKRHLEIDLLRPEGETSLFPPHDLSPLCLYRELQSLKIIGMMRSYQWYIWLVVWLNPQLRTLTLEMAGEAEPLDMKAIAQARKYAECKPTMREVAQGKTKAEVLNKFHIVNLSLTNFVVHEAPFRWFSDTTLQKVELFRCQDAGFQLPIIMERGFNITVTA